jgi:hypothetical protein
MLVLGGDGAPVTLDERLDNGQSESRPAGSARGVGAAESVEGVWEKVGWETATVVADTDLDGVGADATILKSMLLCRHATIG